MRIVYGKDLQLRKHIMVHSWIVKSQTVSCSVVFDSLQPHGLWPASLLFPWGFSREEYWSGLPCPPPGDIPNPGIKPRCPALQVGSLPSEPSREPKNTGVHTLSLLQGIFPTQESNWCLLHCRQILYQLNGIIGFCFLILFLP